MISLIGIIPLFSLLFIDALLFGTFGLKSELGGDNGDSFDGTYLFSSEVGLINSPKSTSKTGIISEDGSTVLVATSVFPSIDGPESKILQSSSVNTSPSLLFAAFFY